MLVVYNGVHPEVVVDEMSQETVIKAGEPTEIPDDLAVRLLEQSTWAKAPAKVAAPAPTPAPTPAADTTDSKAAS